MEINFTEINNINNENSYDKYWETSNNIKNEEQVKKKKLSFTYIYNQQGVSIMKKIINKIIIKHKSNR